MWAEIILICNFISNLRGIEPIIIESQQVRKQEKY